MAAVLDTFVRDQVWDRLAQTPAPQLFDRQGITTQTGGTTSLLWQEMQRITVFSTP